jgi:hypothetical protein
LEIGMRLSILLAAMGAALAASGGLEAATTVQIRGAAARVVVIPQARSDVAVSVLRRSAKLPLKVRVFAGHVFITGDVRHRIRGCPAAGGHRGVEIRGRGVIPYDDLPQLLIRTPFDVRIFAGEAVFGDIGRSASLELINQGCGGWTIANVAGHLRLDQAGSGQTRTGEAASADLSVAGSGSINTQAIHGPVSAVSSGAGDITAASIEGSLDVRIAGSGVVRAKDGRVSTMTASIAGSGGVHFGGVAQSLRVSIAGSGGVSVARVTGAVAKRVFGSGKVSVGR